MSGPLVLRLWQSLLVLLFANKLSYNYRLANLTAKIKRSILKNVFIKPIFKLIVLTLFVCLGERAAWGQG